MLFFSWQMFLKAKKFFLLYCAIQKNPLDIENVSRTAYKFIDGKTGFEMDGAYEKYHDSVIAVKRNIDDDVKTLRSEYENEHGEDFFEFICGKFLFTSLFVYLRSVIKENFRKDDLKLCLIQCFDISRLDYVGKTVDKIFASR